jgi:hypothetical protein
MNSRVTEGFAALFSKLPDAVKEQTRKSYHFWRQNPAHPSLHFKRIEGQEQLYSVRVGLGWRAVGLLENDTITWHWIGSHADYDKLLRRH